MYPLVQARDALTFYPFRAVTARGWPRAIPKEVVSEIAVGDIVFCLEQTKHAYFTRIVFDVRSETGRDTMPREALEDVARITCWRSHRFLHGKG